jgi:cytoskeletal protein RodZ
MDSQPGGEEQNFSPEPPKSHKLLIIIILVILLIGAVGFGMWAFSQMQDYKNHSDQKAAVAVAAAKKQQAAELQAQYDEQSKSPYKIYESSPTYGSVKFNYPKTWSGYVDSNNSSTPVDGYFHPDIVPGLQSKTAYALRVQVLNQDYSQVVQQFNSEIAQGQTTSKAYVPPKMQGNPNVTSGLYLTGQINPSDQTQRGNMVIMKVRDKTLEISTQSLSYANDFNSIILSSLTFVP